MFLLCKLYFRDLNSIAGRIFALLTATRVGRKMSQISSGVILFNITVCTILGAFKTKFYIFIDHIHIYHIHILYMYTHTCTHICNMCMHTHVCVFINSCIYVYIYIHTHISYTCDYDTCVIMYVYVFFLILRNLEIFAISLP